MVALVLYLFKKFLLFILLSFRREYHKSVPEVSEFYKSWSGYKDEFAWASSWLYKATKSSVYLSQAKEHWWKTTGGPYWTYPSFSWDQKMAGVAVLMADESDPSYRESAHRFLN